MKMYNTFNSYDTNHSNIESDKPGVRQGQPPSDITKSIKSLYDDSNGNVINTNSDSSSSAMAGSRTTIIINTKLRGEKAQKLIEGADLVTYH